MLGMGYHRTIKLRTEIAKRVRVCKLCGSIIEPGSEFYMTREDDEPKIVRRVTCKRCLFWMKEEEDDATYRKKVA